MSVAQPASCHNCGVSMHLVGMSEYERLCLLEADLRAIKEGKRDVMSGYLAAKFAVAEASLGSLIDSMLAEVDERCPDCGHTPETGACFYCKGD